MDYIQAFILAFVQGVTEFLPISSSAHLVLLSQWLDLETLPLSFEVAVHAGTLIALLSYFRHSLWQMFQGWLIHCTKGKVSDDSRLVWMLLVATVPLVLVTPFLVTHVEHVSQKVSLIATATIFFALALWFSDYISAGKTNIHAMKWPIALFIGMAQVLALIPGTSRSGIVITAALLMGLSRQDATKFAFLLAIPTIGGASVFTLQKYIGSAAEISWGLLAFATIVAGTVAYLTIDLFMRFVQRVGFMPFILYRLIMGAMLLMFVL